jgi:hypothetical protein
VGVVAAQRRDQALVVEDVHHAGGLATQAPDVDRLLRHISRLSQAAQPDEGEGLRVHGGDQPVAPSGRS